MPADQFCGSCGLSVVPETSAEDKKSITMIIAFYAATLLFLGISYFVYLETDVITVGTELTLEIIFVLLIVGFSLTDLRNIIPLYGFKLVDWKALLFSLVFPVLSAFLVILLLGKVNVLLFDEDPLIMAEYAFYDRPFLWAFLFICVVAPVFEELAFRGFLFNHLQRVTSVQGTILATAFLFALIHLSYLSIIWIFPFGVVLGYLRHKYKTLWLGMIVHFIHNGVVLVMDYKQYYGRWPLEHYF